MNKKWKSLMAAMLLTVGVGLVGCSNQGNEEKVIIYSNADDEAITAMKNALDEGGYKDQYVFQTFGTSELGGKLKEVRSKQISLR